MVGIERYRGRVDTTPDPEPVDDAPGSDGLWSEDELAELADTEATATDNELDEHQDPLRFNSWMKRSATGAVMTGIALGFQEALTVKKEKPAFVMEAPSRPEDDDAPIRLHFDPDNPANTVAVIRHPPGGAPPTTGGAGS
jgi:hypothetical protein